MRTCRLLLVVAAFVAGVFRPHAVDAQQVDVIRGRVTGPDSLAVENVRITVTSISGSVSRTARTDRTGRFTVTFPNGDGDYLVSFAAIGYGPQQFEVKRTADQDILVADAKLSEVAQVLDPVESVAQTPVNRNDTPADVSGTDRTLNTAAGAADLAGDLAAAAASVPGVLFLPGEGGDPNGFSVLGLGADQNNATLNGVDFGGSSLPRDASVSTSLVTTPYDVSRGGFSGAQTAIRTRSGSNILVRGTSLNVDAPQLQWTDRAAQALGTEYTNLSLGGLASGPFVLNKAFYNVSYQLGRRSNDLQTLLNTSPLGLEAAGVAPDSVTRLLAGLRAAKIPLSVGHVGQSRISDQGSLLGSFDLTSPSSSSGSAYNFSFNGNWGDQSPATGSATELPAHSGDRTNWTGGVQARHSGYFKGFLSETSVGANLSRNYATPYLALPSGRVLVNSSLSDGTSGVQTLSFGGSPSLSSRQTTTAASFLNQLSWFSGANKHRLKLTTEFGYDGSSQNLANNLLGSYAFNSIADFEAGTPSSFTRQLNSPQRNTGQIRFGESLGDSYRRSADLQLQYGVRLDANHFLSTPTFNPDVQTAFGVRNDNVPNRVYLSPRIGFSWSYGAAPQIAGFVGAVRGPRAVVRGGIGLFQNTPAPTLLGTALDNTGLASAVQQLNCVGAAAPTPNWAEYASNPASIPSQCADGTMGTVFASTAPNVSLFSKDYAASRSIRSNLSWTGPVIGDRLNLTAQATYSLNLNQPSSLDLNFNSVTQFALSDEGGRPVFVKPTSIVPTTGAIASGDARVSPLFSRVTENLSDLRSDSRQISLAISPVLISSTKFSWNLTYVLSDVREQSRGFSSTVGNPLAVDWAESAANSTHQISYGLNYNFFNLVRVSWSGSFRSGTAFTPGIVGDVNGDGYSNDRAFIFDPARTADTAVASAMRSLLANGSTVARTCLTKQLGTLAGRNSCRGPWTSTASLSITLDPVKFRLPHRATLNLSVSNPLGAADLLVNGSDHLRGWGQPPNLDPSLLYVRGFNAQTQQYAYEVNQRFGSRSTALGSFRTPVTVTALIKFDIGPVREEQNLSQELDRGRTLPGTAKYSEATFKTIVGSAILDPLTTILRAQDTLQLTGTQADSIAVLNRMFTIRVDSMWAPVAKDLAELPDHYDEGEAYNRYLKAREAAIDLLISISPDIKGLLTPAQRRILPASALNYLDPRFLEAIRSGTGVYLGTSGATSGIVFGN